MLSTVIFCAGIFDDADMLSAVIFGADTFSEDTFNADTSDEADYVWCGYAQRR